MNLYETTTHSFIVKIWLEEADADQAMWRGHITHVSSGERRYLQRLEDIPLFLIPYLKQVGVRIGVGWHVVELLRRWQRRFVR